MKQFLSSVRENIAVADGYNLLTFDWPPHVGIKNPLPGQFITIRNGYSTDPLLRRPFAVSAFHADSHVCEIVYQIRGSGTRALSACSKGDKIDIIGPLGNGFPAPRPGRRVYLVAGGIGFGPIYFLAHSIAKTGNPPVILIGARTKALIPDVSYDRLLHKGDALVFCTDDGSKGFHGTVVDKLESFENLKPGECEIYACGPRGMLAGIAKLTEAADITCWVSMEQVMGCGVGACMGCAIRAREPGKYLRVCTEGPVFNAKDLAW